MNIKPIRNELDYRATLVEIEGLMMAKQGSPKGERLDVLVTLVEAYEAKNYPLDLPDPIAAITFAEKGSVTNHSYSHLSPTPFLVTDPKHSTSAWARKQYAMGTR